MYDNGTRSTAYSEYVFSNLTQRMRDGGGLYSYSELAALVGLKPTGNFRRRVKQLVKSGQIETIAAFTPRGGLEARFQVADRVLQNGEFPF